MKTLLTLALCLFAIVAHAANPSTKSFRATGGLVVTSNDVTGIITYDGSAIVGSTNAPDSSTSAGRGMSNLVWSRVLHVDSLFGTNATAIRGDASKPWRDVHWAHSNAVAGDTVFIRPGYYDLGTNHIRGTPGVSIVGSGLKGAILTGTGLLLTEGPLIGAASTQLVANLTLITLASGNTFHAGWGSVVGINAAFTNARLENVEMITDTDGIYVNHTAPCSGRVFDCRVDSRWDCWVSSGNSNHFFEVWNTSATANNFQPPGGAITNEANTGQAATCLRNLSGTIEWHGGTLIATNGEFDGTFAVTPDNSGVHTNFTRLYGVRLVAAGTNDTARILVVSPATHGFVYEFAGEPIFTQPTAGAYQALYFDGVISVTNAVSRTITLPDIAPLARDVWTGLRLTIHDRSQLAATTNIFISASGNQRINGSIVTTNISTTGGFMELLVVGTNWYVVNLGSLGGSGTPAGANGDVQYNNAGAFGAESSFNYDAGDDTLSVTGLIAQVLQIYNSVTFLTSNTVDIGTFLLPGRTSYVNQVETKGINVRGGAAGSIALSDTDASHAVSFVAAGVMSSNIVFTFPTGVSNGYFRITSVTDSNFTVTFDTPAGGGSIVTNDNQFGASTTLTIKDAAAFTNSQEYGVLTVNGAVFQTSAGTNLNAWFASNYFGGAVQIASGSPAVGRVLTTDAAGNATWENAITNLSKLSLGTFVDAGAQNPSITLGGTNSAGTATAWQFRNTNGLLTLHSPLAPFATAPLTLSTNGNAVLAGTATATSVALANAGSLTGGTLAGLHSTASGWWRVSTSAGTGQGGLVIGSTVTGASPSLGSTNGILALMGGDRLFGGGNTNHLWIMGGAIIQDFSFTAPVAPDRQGAAYWNDGTNVCVVLRNSAGTLSTNKLTMTAWP